MNLATDRDIDFQFTESILKMGEIWPDDFNAIVVGCLREAGWGFYRL